MISNGYNDEPVAPRHQVGRDFPPQTGTSRGSVTAVNPLLLLSATDLARRIRAREVTSREVVEAHLARIREVNPRLNAVVADRFDDARREADAADAAVKEGRELPPFHGVPCTIKECFRLAGMPNSSGLVARKHVRADGDATAVARLRAAGAIPMGVTNVSELCMWMETNNRVYGRTNNPYDARRIVGGSSGGEGAIVGAGASPFGLGSDIGGSIRMPAFFNGVFGHKPSAQLVPGTGQYPMAENRARRMLTTGPLTRRAEDLAPLTRIMAGPDGEDAEPMELGDPATVDLKSLTVLDVEGNGGIEVSSDLRAAQRRVAEHLAAKGATVKRASFEGLAKSFDIWSGALASAGGRSFAELLGDGTPVKALRLLPAWAVRRSPHTLPAILLALLESLGKRIPGRIDRARHLEQKLRAELDDALGERGVILYPSYPKPAPLHYVPLALTFHWVYTAIFNVMELPVTQVPLGLNEAGVPLGVQVVARHGSDHVTMAVGLELERAFGGWVPPRS